MATPNCSGPNSAANPPLRAYASAETTCTAGAAAEQDAHPLDEFSRPCALHLAAERFAEPMKEMRKVSRARLLQGIGNDLSEIVDRDLHAVNALRLARASLPNSTDEDGVEALLEMAIPYGVATGNILFRLVGSVLVALELVNSTSRVERGAS